MPYNGSASSPTDTWNQSHDRVLIDTVWGDAQVHINITIWPGMTGERAVEASYQQEGSLNHDYRASSG